MFKVTVLGAGMVGGAMARDLAGSHSVCLVDRNKDVLAKFNTTANIKTKQADLRNPADIQAVIADADIVIGAVPGFMGFETLETVVKAKKNIVDISFFDEEAYDISKIDQLAKDNGVIAIMDCGVAPGMSNLLFGYHHTQMKIESFECLVGGLPKKRTYPYEYKAPFSPIDVIEEYTRPARFVKDGKLITKPALTDPELLEFEPVGTLEAFNSDGLRTLLKTMNAPNMIERTLRYPKHIEIMAILRESGFFSKDKIKIGPVEISPLDLSSHLLFKHWHLKPNEEEFTIMRIIVSGHEDREFKTYQYDLFDQYDIKTGVASMSRTTGYTCTAVANLILDGKFKSPGLHPPELLGNEANVKYILDYLSKRNVHYKKTIT
jgi:saccharopine dehydrogenase-like NADP-dependent oxidoreductase